MERLDKSLLDHTVAAGTKEGGPEIVDVYRLQGLSEVHCYLKIEHDFTAAEVTALMQFADPLEVAAMCWEERDPEAAFFICGLLDKIKAYEIYPLVNPASYAQDQEQLITAAKAMLDQNMREYHASLLCLDPPELIAKSAEIAAMQEAYDFMKIEYKFERGDAEALLRMENPLRFVAEQWPDDISSLFDMSGHVGEALDAAAKAVTHQRGEESPAQAKAAVPSRTEKPSIRGQLRDAVRDTGQPPKDKAKGGDAR